MTHLELENLVSDYLEGRLATAGRAQAEEHLAACEACRELVEGVRQVMELCSSTEDLEPAPWLVPRILLATTGEPKPSLRERLTAYLRPVLQPRFAYTVAMAVFSFSIIVNAAGINLRHLRLQDLNPRTWFYQANRNGHLLYARVEKFYYDLRVVYEIESRLKQLRQQPGEGGSEEQAAPKQENPGGGSTDGGPVNSPRMASLRNVLTAAPWLTGSRSDSLFARSITR
jgi:hypothetical protein